MLVPFLIGFTLGVAFLGSLKIQTWAAGYRQGVGSDLNRPAS